MLRRIILPLFLLPVIALAAPKPIKVTSSIKTGSTISGDANFEIIVQSEDLVTGVEFYVGKDLRLKDDSTPYEYTLDTIREPEGPIDIKVIVLTEAGDQKELDLKYIIDNELGKGADYWVDEANKSITESKWDDAILSGRKALKAKKGYNKARTVLAVAYYRKGVLDSAQRYAEDILATEPENVLALDILSSINLRNAFKGGTGSDTEAQLKAIRSALTQAASNREKANTVTMNGVGAATDENRLRYAETALRTHRYSLAIQALEPLYRANLDNNPAVNALLYAQMRAGRWNDAVATAVNYGDRGKPDAEGFALLSLVYNHANEPEKAASFERQAALNDATSVAVRLAQAQRAWANGDFGNFAKVTSGLQNDYAAGNLVNSQVPIQLLLSRAMYRTGEYELGRDTIFEAVLAAPDQYDLYIQQGIQILGQSFETNVVDTTKTYQRKLARIYFDAAIAAKPDSFEALTALALMNLVEKNNADALRNYRTATKAGPEYAGAYYVGSIALQREQKRLSDAQTELKTQISTARGNNLSQEAEKLEKTLADVQTALTATTKELETATEMYAKYDKKNLLGTEVPTEIQALGYLVRAGQTPLLTLTSLMGE